MVIDMNEERLDSIEQLAQFLALTAVLSPRVFGGAAERQSHVLRVLSKFDYPYLGRADKGVVSRYLVHVTGYSKQHLTKLFSRFVGKQPLGQRQSPVVGFNRRYTDADILLLATVDKLHVTPSGQAIKHLRGANLQPARHRSLSRSTCQVAAHTAKRSRFNRCAQSTRTRGACELYTH